MKKNNLLNNKIVVTGGAGLIGSFLSNELVKIGCDVIVVDDFSKGRIEYISDITNSIEIRKGNLEVLSFTKEALSDAKIVFHLASRAYGIGYSKGHNTEILLHNEKITNNLFETVEYTKPEYILITSSSCVYSDNGPDLIPELPLFKDEPEMANWGYGWAKRFLEQKANIFKEETNIPIGIVRPFNIYGENYTWVEEFSQAIPMLVKKVMDNNKEITVWGSGDQRRSYVHAQDCAKIMIELAKKKFSDGPLNIGTNETINIKSLVHLICEASNNYPNIIFDSEKPEGRHIKSSDVLKFNSTLPDFQYEISLKDGIRRMLQWYRLTFNSNN